MKNDNRYISIQKICTSYEISQNLLLSMQDFELVEIIYTEKIGYIELEEIANLERYIRLYHDLGINVEGLCVIKDLLKERELLKEEINTLKSKIK